MSVKNYEVKLLPSSDIREFIETWHYSGSINGVKTKYCFGLFDKDKLIGAMIYGTLGMANAWKKYGKEESEVLELRRLCCIDDTPKNTESYFIGKTLRWLKSNTNIKTVVSYSDLNYGHEGIIYKASNFEFKGKTSKGKMIKRLCDGKLYHDKSIRTKYKGKLKPFAQKLKSQLENGEAVYIDRLPKNIYVYILNKGQ